MNKYIKLFENYMNYEISESEFHENISDYWETTKKEIPLTEVDKENLKDLIKYLRKKTNKFSKTTFNKGKQILLDFYLSDDKAPDNFRIYRTDEYYFLIELFFNDDIIKYYKFQNIFDMIKLIKNKIETRM